MTVSRYIVTSNGDLATYEVEPSDTRGRARVRREGDEEWREVSLDRAGDGGLFLLTLDDRPRELYLERRRGGVVATIGRHVFDCDVSPWRPAGARPSQASSAGVGPLSIKAPMTGSVVEVLCKPGDAVEADTVLLVIESMKMNNEIRAPMDATVESVPVEPGQRISAGDSLISLLPRPEASDEPEES